MRRPAWSITARPETAAQPAMFARGRISASCVPIRPMPPARVRWRRAVLLSRQTPPAHGGWMLRSAKDVFRHGKSGDLQPCDTSISSIRRLARFITLTHERYRDRMGDAFRNVDAFFTDEPQLGNRGMRKYVVRTPGLEDKFRTEYGYELNLPSLFSGNTDADRLCRMQYYRLVAASGKATPRRSPTGAGQTA